MTHERTHYVQDGQNFLEVNDADLKRYTHNPDGRVRSGPCGYPLYLRVYNTERNRLEYRYRCECSGKGH